MSNLDEFPKYPDGDVFLMVTAIKSYQLHSSVLRRNSSWFAAQIDEKEPPKLNVKARKEHSAAYRFELDNLGVNGVGRFSRKVRVTPLVTLLMLILSARERLGSGRQHQLWLQ